MMSFLPCRQLLDFVQPLIMYLKKCGLETEKNRDDLFVFHLINLAQTDGFEQIGRCYCLSHAHHGSTAKNISVPQSGTTQSVSSLYTTHQAEPWFIAKNNSIPHSGNQPVSGLYTRPSAEPWFNSQEQLSSTVRY